MRLPNPLRVPARALALLPLCIAAAASGAQAQSSRAALVARLDSVAGSGVVEGRAAGMTVAVVHRGDTLLLKPYGQADIELDVPTPARAVYEIGSVTKQFTAAAILQLRDAGKVDLDAEINRYLPDYPTQGHRVTVRRLLDHTSGIRGISEIPAFRSLMVRDLPRDSAVALFAREPFDFAPGEAMIYNNSAYLLLGHIIEKVSGMTYEDYIEQRIFAPLGMADSHYCSNTEVVERRTHGYLYQGRNVRRGEYVNHTWPWSAGSLCSTAGDMVKWLQALHGGTVLSERSYREMTTPARLNDGTELRYGMGLSLGNDIRGARHIAHGGSIASGYTAFAQWYPDAELAVVVLMNSGGAISPQAIASELGAEIIPPVRPTLAQFTGDAASLVGRYAGPSRGSEMVVEISLGPQGGVLASMDGSPPRPLPWTTQGLTFRLGDTFLTFDVPPGGGPATRLRVDGGAGYYMLKRSEK